MRRHQGFACWARENDTICGFRDWAGRLESQKVAGLISELNGEDGGEQHRRSSIRDLIKLPFIDAQHTLAVDIEWMTPTCNEFVDEVIRGSARRAEEGHHGLVCTLWRVSGPAEMYQASEQENEVADCSKTQRLQ